MRSTKAPVSSEKASGSPNAWRKTVGNGNYHKHVWVVPQHRAATSGAAAPLLWTPSPAGVWAASCPHARFPGAPVRGQLAPQYVVDGFLFCVILKLARGIYFSSFKANKGRDEESGSEDRSVFQAYVWLRSGGWHLIDAFYIQCSWWRSVARVITSRLSGRS